MAADDFVTTYTKVLDNIINGGASHRDAVWNMRFISQRGALLPRLKMVLEYRKYGHMCPEIEAKVAKEARNLCEDALEVKGETPYDAAISCARKRLLDCPYFHVFLIWFSLRPCEQSSSLRKGATCCHFSRKRTGQSKFTLCTH